MVMIILMRAAGAAAFCTATTLNSAMAKNITTSRRFVFHGKLSLKIGNGGGKGSHLGYNLLALLGLVFHADNLLLRMLFRKVFGSNVVSGVSLEGQSLNNLINKSRGGIGLFVKTKRIGGD